MVFSFKPNKQTPTNVVCDFLGTFIFLVMVNQVIRRENEDSFKNLIICLVLLMAMNLVFSFSKASFNPAVSLLKMFNEPNFSLDHVLCIVAQFFAAIAAFVVFDKVLKKIVSPTAPGLLTRNSFRPLNTSFSGSS